MVPAAWKRTERDRRRVERMYRRRLARAKAEILRAQTPRPCDECGGPIPPWRTAAAGYCSDACKQRAYRRRAAESDRLPE
jgi:RNA polymerase-binding transcription factor DksA